MTSAVAVILSWSRRHRTVVAVSTLALALVSFGGIRRLTFDTDILSLLPRDGRAIPAFRSFLAGFGSLDQLYIVFSAPAGRSIADYEEEIDEWIDALRKTPVEPSIRRTTSAGWPIGSCFSSTKTRSQMRWSASAATVCDGQSPIGGRCWPCLHPRSRSWCGRIRSASSI